MGGDRRVRRCLAALALLQAQVLANKPVRRSHGPIWMKLAEKCLINGQRKSSPYFDKINEIIGKKDSVTLKHIVSAGNPSPPLNQDDQESSKPDNCEEEKDDGDDEDIKAKGKAAKQTRRERKLKRKGLKRPLEQSLEDEEEKERAKTFDQRMESMEKQGAKMADTMQNIVTSMQAAQAQ